MHLSSSSPVQSDQDDISDWDDVSEILAVDEHDTKQGCKLFIVKHVTILYYAVIQINNVV